MSGGGLYIEQITSGTTLTIPTGVSGCAILAQGAGGAGGSNAGGGGGGGSGGEAYKDYEVLEAEWGTNLTIAVGQGAVASNGGNTTVDGTLGGATITQLKGSGGVKASGTTGGAGGAASGGDTNTSGGDGEDGDGGGANGAGGTPPQAVNLSQHIQNDTLLRGTGGIGKNSGTTNRGKHGAIVVAWKY